jgi:hypothetical protein
MMTQDEVYEELTRLADPQLDYIVEKWPLDRRFLSHAARATRAAEILHQLEHRASWLADIGRLINEVKTSTSSYFHQRLAYIHDFLVEPPEPRNTSSEAKGTIKELRDGLKKVGTIDEPQLIKVKGTLFPAALLTAGWWERKGWEFKMKWKDPELQQWLFEGFDLWAPSWDISWDFEGREQNTKPYYIAQLTEGDEADSLPVIIPTLMAKEFRDKFRKSWGGLEVEVKGVLGHRSQAQKELELSPGELSPGQAYDYCIWLKDGEQKHGIDHLSARSTDLYSGYLWKCLVPEEWIKEDRSVDLGQVYFVWEHTNFAAQKALDYNLAGLRHKESFIKKHRKSALILLAKSHAIVPGDPKWPVDDFYNLLLGKEVKLPTGLAKQR